ncbi:MAG: hypothetical protein U2P59_00165 [Synergistota bacterium]|nr:hypothetical protein [Synergistota bacterium]
MRRKGSFLAEIIALSFIALISITVVVSTLSSSIAIVQRAKEKLYLEKARSEVLAGLYSGSFSYAASNFSGGCSVKEENDLNNFLKISINLSDFSEGREIFVHWPSGVREF